MQRRANVQAQDNTLYGPTGEPLIRGPNGAGTQSLTRGGIVNDLAGLGGASDKSQATYFLPTRFYTRYPLEILYAESWAAAHFVDMPVDDMWVRGREWESEEDDKGKISNQDTLDKLNEGEMMLEINQRMANAMKAGRLYGTGMAIMMTNEAMLDTPLDVDRIREGDLTNILVVDRFDCNPRDWIVDPWDTDYYRPNIYEIQLETGLELTVHHSRVLRFDGRAGITANGWSGFYDQGWGLSTLLYAITEIIHEASITSNISQLSFEASIPVIKKQDFTDMMAGMPSGDDPGVSVLGSRINLYKSLYRIMFMDSNDDFERVGVQIQGWADILDFYWKKLAAIAQIPATRFFGRSPEGMNATGESDMNNYAISVLSLQERMLTRPLSLFDKVMARNLGLSEPGKYKWRPLTDVSDREQAEVDKLNTESLSMALDRQGISEDEYRERLSNIPLFGSLGPMPDEIVQEREERKELELESMRQGMNNDDSGGSGNDDS